MPILKNPKHEVFARELKCGAGALESLKTAGIDIRCRVSPQGYYVYVLINPRDYAVFYVGKGKNRRMHQHVADWRNNAGCNREKLLRIGDILRARRRPLVVCLQDGLSQDDAYRAERHVMFSIGLDNLTNSMGAPLPEEDRIALQCKDNLRMIRPYCRMFSLDPPAPRHWEPLYWGIVADFWQFANKKKSAVSPEAHYDEWKRVRACV